MCLLCVTDRGDEVEVMNISMYEASVPVFLHTLKGLRAILQKGVSYADAKKIDSSVLAASRLFPDMFPLTRQVQIATDAAKGAAARLAGIEIPRFEDTETTLVELIARVDKTVAFLQSVKPEQMVGSEDRVIELKNPRTSHTFSGLVFLRHWAIPNFFFHVTTTYNLLRHNGVEIGKDDYLSPAGLK
jgi:uncharacterized protein